MTRNQVYNINSKISRKRNKKGASISTAHKINLEFVLAMVASADSTSRRKVRIFAVHTHLFLQVKEVMFRVM